MKPPKKNCTFAGENTKMENKHRFVVIMAGGVGSRFWPESRQHLPKQFLDIMNTGRSLIQSTYDRISELCPKENIFIVTHRSYLHQVQQQLPDIDKANILCEPSRKNTAPAIAFVSYKIQERDANALIMVTPADHLILQELKFISVVNEAFGVIERQSVLLTLGIKPSRPDTGYGYIQYNQSDDHIPAYKVKIFTEKPNLELARSFLKSGDFLWNSGMFFWRVEAIMTAFSQYLPEMADLFSRGFHVSREENQEAIIEKIYSQCSNLSIDIGIMEKAANVFVIPANFGWTDLGTWESIYELQDRDHEGNAQISSTVMTYDTNDSFVKVPKGKLAIVQGLDRYIVIDTEDVLLICERSKEQEIKEYVSDAKDQYGDKYI